MRVLSPSKITAWLDCAHYATMLDLADAGRVKARTEVGSFAQLLMDKGMAHEKAYLDLLARDTSVFEVPDKEKDETFAAWAQRCAPLLSHGHEVIYQMPFVHDGIRGVADFLFRVDEPSALGDFSYEPVDAKLARAEAKPGHVLQLCFYADAIEAVQGCRPKQAHLHLGSGETESIRLADVSAYWRRLRRKLRAVVDADVQTDTVPTPCRHCEFCEFAPACEQTWREADALHYVAGIRTQDIETLAPAGVTTLTALAAGPTETDLAPERLAVLRQQARLQAAAIPGQAPPFEVLPAGVNGAGELDAEQARRRQLPAPSDGDVFLDFEGHPFWSAPRGLFFMFGLLYRDDAGQWSYEARWAHTVEEEAALTGDFIEWVANRRAQHPGMHVYHYNHTERSSLERLAAEHGQHEHLLTELTGAGVFVDLLDVVRQSLRVGAESYSLKVLELLAGYERDHDIDAGAGAVVEYESWMADRDDARLARIARYNEDDVAATRAVRDWLLTGPLAGDEPRPDVEVTEKTADTDELVAGLLALDQEWTTLLAHTLEYWSREGRAHRAQNLPPVLADEADRLEHPDVITGLQLSEVLAPVGRQRNPRAVLSFPPQQLGSKITTVKPKRLTRLMFPIGEGQVDNITIHGIDVEAGELTIAWSDEPDRYVPPAAVVNTWHSPGAKFTAVQSFAQRVLGGESRPSDVLRRSFLRGEGPEFADGGVSPGGVFPSSVEEIVDVAAALTGGCLPVQGPPGTGKTYVGSRMIARLLDEGKRVAITSNSHHAIDNLLRAVMGDRPHTQALRQGDPNSAVIEDVRYGASAKDWASGDHELFASTAWSLANEGAVDTADVLVIDEAGQVGLADALAAMSCARAVVLLGDPLQLAQVNVATHPGGSGASSLEHVLAGEATIPPERGIFLDTTWRMHPGVSDCLSEQIYDGRLAAHPQCAGQSVAGKAGLRWVRAEHEGNDTSSVEEAALVAETIWSLLGQPWVDFDGNTRPMTPGDVMVVAPYNDHVNLVRGVLADDPALADARVGTVDKFQGQEAAVVIFTMATSSGATMPRGPEFLFSRNRLNVALSRARALAYVVCTEDLLDARAASVEEMRLIGTLGAFVERARLS